MTHKKRGLTPEEEALVSNNIALAKFLFQKQWARLKNKAEYGVDADDLLSHAYYGLIRAALRYREYGEEKGYSEESIASGQFFSVFARKSINGQMLDHLRKLDHVHTLVRKDYKLLQEQGLFNSDRTEQEVADAAEISYERAQKVIKLVHSRPVNMEDAHGSQTVGDSLSTEGSVESSALETSLKEALVKAIDGLEPKVQDIIYLKYYLGYELPEIALEVNDTLTSVRRYHSDALALIHDVLVSRVLGA